MSKGKSGGKFSGRIVRAFLMMGLGATLASNYGCQTIAGIGGDVQELARWTEEKVHNGWDRDGSGRNYRGRD